jgi:Protein of unknown function (DUF3800)
VPVKPEEPNLRPDDLLVFIDETGDVQLSDPNHQLFGLGGCALPAPLYLPLIAEPWSRLKQAFFGGVENVLHASSMRPTNEQISALAGFFRNGQFMRIACLVDRTSGARVLYDTYGNCSTMIHAFIHQVAAGRSYKRIVIVVEASEALDRFAGAYFGNPSKFNWVEHDYLPVEVWRNRKSDRVAGLEVADFIMHAAGGQMRKGSLRGDDHRQDFRAVFSEVPDKWVRFAHLTD